MLSLVADPNEVTQHQQQHSASSHTGHQVQSLVRPRKWSSTNLKSSVMLCYHVILHCDNLSDSLHLTPHLILPIYDFMNIAQHYLVACLLCIPMMECEALYQCCRVMIAGKVRSILVSWAGPNWYRWYLHKLDTPLVVADLQLASCLLQLPASIKTTFDINTGTKAPKNLKFANTSRQGKELVGSIMVKFE